MFIYLFSTIDLLYRSSENNYSAFHHHPFVFTLISTKARCFITRWYFIYFLLSMKTMYRKRDAKTKLRFAFSASPLLRMPFALAVFFLFTLFVSLFLLLLLRQIDTSPHTHTHYVRTQWLHTIMLYKQLRTKFQRKRLRYHYNICWMRLCTCWLYEINWKETEPRRNKAHFPLNLS